MTVGADFIEFFERNRTGVFSSKTSQAGGFPHAVILVRQSVWPNPISLVHACMSDTCLMCLSKQATVDAQHILQWALGRLATTTMIGTGSHRTRMEAALPMEAFSALHMALRMLRIPTKHMPSHVHLRPLV